MGRSMKTMEGFRLSADGRFVGFLYFDRKLKKNMRYGAKQGWPGNVTNLDQAKRERQIAFGKIDAQMTAAAQRLEWQKKYSDFDKLIQEYELWIRKTLARSTIETYLSYLKNYVFFYFLKENQLNNVETWPREFKKFRAFLETVKPLKISGTLAVNSRNNTVKALNSFLKFLEEEHFMGPFVRCAEFATTKEDRRGLKDIYTEKDFAKLLKAAKEVDNNLAIYLHLLYTTGLRANEALGLHIKSFTFGATPTQKRGLFKRIIDSGIDVYGFILLKDQPALAEIYDKNGKVPRRPLKSRREVASMYNRYIPVINEELADGLVELIERRKAENKGKEAEDILVFGFSYSHMYREFCRIRSKLKLDKDIHSLRHSYATWLTRKCEGDKTVSAEVLGQSERIAEIYIHLAEEHEAEQKQQSSIGKVKRVVL